MLLARIEAISFIFGSFCIFNCRSRINGAPIASCKTFVPDHGTDFSEQTDVSSYFTITAVPTGQGDKSVKVTLSAVVGNRLFKGFMIKAIPGKYDANDWEDPPRPVGTWEKHDDNKLLKCFRIEKSVVTHVDADLKREASFLWYPPMSSSTETVSFVATVVENLDRYFSGIHSDEVSIK